MTFKPPTTHTGTPCRACSANLKLCGKHAGRYFEPPRNARGLPCGMCRAKNGLCLHHGGISSGRAKKRARKTTLMRRNDPSTQKQRLAHHYQDEKPLCSAPIDYLLVGFNGWEDRIVPRKGRCGKCLRILGLQTGGRYIRKAYIANAPTSRQSSGGIGDWAEGVVGVRWNCAPTGPWGCRLVERGLSGDV